MTERSTAEVPEWATVPGVLLKGYPGGPWVKYEEHKACVERAETRAVQSLRKQLISGEDRARLELIRDHDGNDLSENDKALLTRLAELNEEGSE